MSKVFPRAVIGQLRSFIFHLMDTHVNSSAVCKQMHALCILQSKMYAPVPEAAAWVQPGSAQALLHHQEQVW